MPNVFLSDKALKDFMYWAHNDRKILDKIDSLLNDIDRNGVAKGIGKPERLKHQEAYSWRIDDANRLVYKVHGDETIVLSCRGHYEDK
ncbi:MAG: Txe/YoeB family addiction module toxin [Selenomonadaceae bacterium]|nr:Txe/YoeB family addiction module toxin [Selenomonadaceae bacterium]